MQINAGSIKYYGSKAGWFRPCKGDLVAVCKEVITNTEDELKPQPAPDSMIEFNNIKQESNNQEQVLNSGNELIIYMMELNILFLLKLSIGKMEV